MSVEFEGLRAEIHAIADLTFGQLQQWGLDFDNRGAWLNEALDALVYGTPYVPFRERVHEASARRALFRGSPLLLRPRPPTIHTKLADRDGWACHYCGRPLTDPREVDQTDGAMATADHVIPRSLGGLTLLENLVLACRPCNSRKRDRVDSHWGNVGA